MKVEHSREASKHRYECWDDYGCSVVASAVVLEHEGYAYLQDINVCSSQRGGGIGTELLKTVLADFSEVSVIADVFEDRFPWYEKHGFEQIGRNNQLVNIIKSP